MFKRIDTLRFWCNKILPLVYDDSLSYYETLCKVAEKINEMVEDINNIPAYIQSLVSEDILKQILSGLLDELRVNIASINEGESKTATAPRTVGELVWLNGELYRITHDMIAGDQYVNNSNCVKTTVEVELNRVKSELTDSIGELSASINDALQELNTKVNNIKMYTFYSLSEMLNYDLKVGESCITLQNGHKNIWVIKNSGTPNSYCRKLKNNSFAVLSGVANIKGLIVNENDVTTLINECIEGGYPVYLPSGVYYANIVMNTKGATLYGDGTNLTFIEPAINAPIVQINGEQIVLKDVKLQSMTHFNEWTGVKGIFSTQGMVRCVVENVLIENTHDGVHCLNTGVLWCTFKNVRAYGVHGIGFRFEATGSQINNNNFIACEVTNTTSFSWYFYDPNNLSFGNNLYGCTIEGNGATIGSFAGDETKNALFNGGTVLNLNGCYFENNKGTAIIQNWRSIYILNCVFINETIPLFNNGGSFVQCVLMWCYGHSYTGSLYQSGSGTLTDSNGNYGLPSA